MKQLVDEYGHVFCLGYVIVVLVSVLLLNTLGYSEVVDTVLKVCTGLSLVLTVYLVGITVIDRH